MQAHSITTKSTTRRDIMSDRQLRSAITFSMIAAIVGVFIGAIALNDDPLLGSALGAGVGYLAGAVFGALTNWRIGLVMLVLLLLAEDSLRKAVPGSPYTISLGKDFLIAACYASYLFRPDLRRALRPADNLERWGIYLPILLWMCFIVLQAANPALPNLIVGVSGIRTWIMYFPMMILMSNFFRDGDSADKFFRALAYLAIPIFIVTFLQNSFYADMPSFLKETASQKLRILESGGEVRYNESIFATPTLLALVCVFQLCIIIGLLKTQRSRRQTFWLWVSGYCTVMSAHLSGIRTGLMFCAIAVLCALPLILYRFERLRGRPRTHRPGLITGGMIGLILGGLVVGLMTGNRAEAFWTSIQPSLVGERMEVAIEVTDDFGGGLLGNGTGSAGKSGRVMNLLGKESPGNESVEWGTALLRYSFGVIGLVLGGFLAIWAFLGMLRVATMMREARFAALRWMLWIYLGAQISWFLFKAYPVFENGTMGVLFWSSAGLLIGLRRLDERELGVA